MTTVTIEQVMVTLEQNNNIDNAVKENMKELILLFCKTYPQISLYNLDRILKTLTIEKSNKFMNRRIFKYNIASNVLEFNTEEMEKGFDMKHIMMSAILSLIACDGDKIGFNIGNHYEALQAAYIEMLTNLLVGNEGDNSYLEDEVISTNLLCTMIDADILFEAFFTNNADKLTQALLDEGVEVA